MTARMMLSAISRMAYDLNLLEARLFRHNRHASLPLTDQVWEPRNILTCMLVEVGLIARDSGACLAR
jgi:hypothetical protein